MSNSPEALKDKELSVPIPLPWSPAAPALPESVVHVYPAAPETVTSAEYAEPATKDVAKAVSPIFFKFIHNSPFVELFI